MGSLLTCLQDTTRPAYDAWMRAMQWKYMPMSLVFLSGLGFSLQTLTVKKLEQDAAFKSTFQLIFCRGFCQMLVSYSFYKAYQTGGPEDKDSALFGNSTFIKKMLVLRSIFGFGGICFAFLAVELLPIGDSTVLVMLSPMFASIFSYFLLGEPWRLLELFSTVVSLIGVVCVAKPSFLFGGAALNPVGVVYGLIASVSAGAAYTIVRFLGTANIAWPQVCFSQSLGQWIPAIPCMLYMKQVTIPTPLQIFIIVATGFLGSWSQIAMTIGMQREKSALACGMRMSDVFFGYIWQIWFTTDNQVSSLSLLGALLVVASILVLVIGKDSSSPTQPSQSNQGGAVEMRGKDTYNVLGVEENDLDSSRSGSTAIDISIHRDDPDPAHGFEAARNISNGAHAIEEHSKSRARSMSGDDTLFSDEALSTVGSRKRLGSGSGGAAGGSTDGLGILSSTTRSQDIGSIKEKLRFAIAD